MAGKLVLPALKSRGQIGAAEDDGIEALAIEERVGQPGQVSVLFFGSPSVERDTHVGVVNLLDLLGVGSDVVELGNCAKELRLDDEARAEDGDTLDGTSCGFLGDAVEEDDERQRRGAGELLIAEMAGHRRNGGEFSAGSLHARKESIEVGLESGAIVCLHVRDNTRGLRMDHDEVELQTVRFTGSRQLAVVVRGRAHPDATQ